MDKKKKVTAYIPEDLNTRMWTHINQASSGTSTYGAVSNFVTDAVTNYLAEPYHTEFIKDNIEMWQRAGFDVKLKEHDQDDREE